MSEPQTPGAGRISLLSPEAARKAAASVDLPEPFAELNVFRMLLHAPRTAKAMSDLLLSLLFGGKLDGRLRELIIMRLGWATDCGYEWTQHWPIAQERFGCSEADLLAVRDWQHSDHLGEREKAVMAAVDETLESGTLSDTTWQRCAEAVGGEVERLELVAAIATWRWISQVARSLEIPLEDGVAAWPPDGSKPS